MTPAWTHWGTSHHFAALRVPPHDGGTGLHGSPLGRARRGGDFVFDPFDAYRAGLVTNPNVVVAGAIGAGKSTVVKMLLDRALARGRCAVVVDPKGEYHDLAHLHGVRPRRVGIDGWCWPSDAQDSLQRDFARSLLACANRAPLDPAQDYCFERAWAATGARRRERPLLALAEEWAPWLGLEVSGPERSLALVTRRLVDGDLAGLFDGAGERLDLDAALVVIDVAAHWGRSSLPAAALSAVVAAQSLAASPREGYLVLDEAWAVLGDDATLTWLQGSWKLARAQGVSHVVVLHRWSDVAAVGGPDSAARARARGLLRDSETMFLLRQPADEAAEMARVLGLTALEQAQLARCGRGTALVRYGAARSVIDLTPTKRDLMSVDSDAAMRER